MNARTGSDPEYVTVWSGRGELTRRPIAEGMRYADKYGGADGVPEPKRAPHSPAPKPAKPRKRRHGGGRPRKPRACERCGAEIGMNRADRRRDLCATCMPWRSRT